MATTHLLLGSNLGDRRHYLKEAQTRIGSSIGEIKRSSSIYRSDPWGNEEQDAFYNQAIEVRTTMDPNRLLKAIHVIEEDLARIRNRRWGPRTIDIDILTYDEEVLVMEGLCVPHRLMHKRRFALEPLNEICSEYRHPIIGIPLSAILAQCKDTHAVFPLND